MTDTPATQHELADPFGEHAQPQNSSRSVEVLGGRFEFHSANPELLGLVDSAYAGLPAQRLARPQDPPRFRIELRLTDGNHSFAGRDAPPLARMQGGAGFFGAVMDAANLALVFPEARRGLVAISRELLRFPYHARYELLEFAVFTLASRAQQLLPLHAGCVGLNGVGALLVGESGAGKSTLALHCMLDGMDFLTEDATFVDPHSLQATGVANFLHLRDDALPFVDDGEVAAMIRNSPRIRRRSGVEKFEIDLRQRRGRLAQAPLQLAKVVLVSPQAADGPDILRPLSAAQFGARLAASQPYAAHQPGWTPFAEHFAHLSGFELRRGRHPRDAALALRRVMEQGAGN